MVEGHLYEADPSSPGGVIVFWDHFLYAWLPQWSRTVLFGLNLHQQVNQIKP